ncbi:hypothetical protein H0H93_009326, partial [Arthromyces matolae]
MELYAVLFRRKPSNTPPIAHISEEAMFKYPREAYEAAFKQYGSVIGVYRKNRLTDTEKLEYIVDESHSLEVLTNDAIFSAERGTAAHLNMPLFVLNALPSSPFATIDKLVHRGVNHIIERVLDTLGPIFQRHMFDLVAQANNATTPVPVDLIHSIHIAMAESMLLLIIGEKNPEPDLIEATNRVSSDVATIAGIYGNINYWSRNFPNIWRTIISIKSMILTPWAYRRIAMRIWNDYKLARETGNTDHMDP